MGLTLNVREGRGKHRPAAASEAGRDPSPEEYWSWSRRQREAGDWRTAATQPESQKVVLH
jgi:hypothetical protein